jgi:hypothetical protein
MRWADSDYQAVVKTLAVVCEVTGAEFSDAAKKLISITWEATHRTR